MIPELPLPIADNIVQANVQCNACHRSLVGVTTGNAGCDTQCKPHGFACGLYGLKGRPSPAADEGAREIKKLDADCDQLMTERDEAEEALSQTYFLVTGCSPEWSNLFGHAEALEEIEDALILLRKAMSTKAAAENTKENDNGR